MFSNPDRNDERARSVTDLHTGSHTASRSGNDPAGPKRYGDGVDRATGSDSGADVEEGKERRGGEAGVRSDSESENIVFRRFEYREESPPAPSLSRDAPSLSRDAPSLSRADPADLSRAGTAVAGSPERSSEADTASSLSEGSTLPDPPPASPAASSASDPTPPAAATERRRTDPLMQSLVLLVTMALMLSAARFAVPRIVEEIRYGWARGELRAEYEAGTRGLHNVSLDSLNEAYQMVTSAVGPSVVHIDVERRRPEITETGTGRVSTAFVPTSDQGSGVVVDEAGHILTNRHVIAEGESIRVTLSDGRQLDGELIGSDPLTDLAVLKVDADRLFPIAWGNSDRCKVGSPVWAIGSPFGLDQTVTFGIVSGKHRMVRAASDASGRHGANAHYQDFMQSDVAVNPGNSGGPLVDAKGTLVGINTAIVGDTFQGVSFSIPSNVAQQVFQRIRDTGRVERGWLGVSLVEVPEEMLAGKPSRVRGALVSAIASGDSPAAAAGLARGDVITHVGDAKIIDSAHLIRVIGGESGGATVEIHVRRDGETLTVPVELGTRPDEIRLR